MKSSHFKPTVLGNVLRFFNGKSIKPGGDGVNPVYGSNGLIGRSGAYTHQNGLIIGRVGAYCGSIKYCKSQFWASDNTIVCQPKDISFDIEYMYFLLGELDLNRYAGGSAQPLLTQTVLRKVPTSIPPLPTQHAIATFLDHKTAHIDELIRAKERKIELLGEYRASLINQAVTKGLDANVEMKPSKIEFIGTIPKEWGTFRCAQVFAVKNIKKTSGEINLSVYRDYGVIRRDSRNDNQNIVSEDTSNYKLVEPGDFVFNKMKCWQGSLGISEYRGIVSPSYTVCKPKRHFHGKYFHYLLRSHSYVQEFKRLSYGVRPGQWELRFKDFKDVLIPYPSLPEQVHVAHFLDHKTKQIDELLSNEEKTIKLLKEYRQSLISEAVTGKIDVRGEV